MTDSVLFSELHSANGLKIGVATLNKPKALNALDLDMIRLLAPKLLAWQQDRSVAMVMLEGSGDKAFCAGGDVVAMYNAMQAEPHKTPDSLLDFFREEYQLDHLIHTFDKPILVWGNGIVMGGGLGLMSGASHRIVTESARIAMPEVTIGLYPDVGGSWFLNKMPTGCGMFLGMTGASINAADALYIHLADHFISQVQKHAFIDQLQIVEWLQDSQQNHHLLTELCDKMQGMHTNLLMPSNVEQHQLVIEKTTNKSSAAEVVDAILSIDAIDDKWLIKAQRTLKNGSPITMQLVFEQLKRGENLSLSDVFRMELNMSYHCGQKGEFQEGVRALLIDKDNTPNWTFATVKDVPANIIEEFFSNPFGDNHPLAGLQE